MLAKNQCFEMTCDAFGQDAQGVCRHEGMAVFVPGLLPGERALVRIVKPEKRYAFGRVEKLLEKSPSRAEPFCPIYKRCGGCVCQHMTYEASLAFKRQQVQDLLQRVGGLSIEVPPVWGMAHPFGYRNKGAYPVAQTDGALLYHCTAGKDRVGVGTMLLLTALGVDWPVIVENYLITNERMAASTDCLLTAVVDYDLSEAEREVIRTFDRADAAFLTAARDAVAERYGSVDAFLTQALGVGAAERAALRARYLTAE